MTWYLLPTASRESWFTVLGIIGLDEVTRVTFIDVALDVLRFTNVVITEVDVLRFTNVVITVADVLRFTNVVITEVDVLRHIDLRHIADKKSLLRLKNGEAKRKRRVADAGNPANSPLVPIAPLSGRDFSFKIKNCPLNLDSFLLLKNFFYFLEYFFLYFSKF